MTTEPTGELTRTLTRAGLLVAPATMVANLLGYAFNLVASRALGPAGYGAAAALLGILLVALVPAMALQTVLARHTALGAGRASTGALLRTAAMQAAAVSAGTALLTPVGTAFLHLDGGWAFLWLAVSLGPLTLTAAVAGILQGGERFGLLALVIVLPPAARFGGGQAALLAGAGVTGVMAGIAIASAATMVLALVLLRPALVGSIWQGGRVRLAGELARAGYALFGLLVLANLDLVLARHYLPALDAGLYAAGALVAKAAFWLPQFVPMIVFARLTDTQRGPAVLRRAAAAILGLGGATVLAAAVAGTPGMRLLVGEEYASAGPLAWAFALLGTALALVQLLLFSGIATSSGRLGAAVWVAAAGEIALIATVAHGSTGQILAAATAGPVCLVGFAALAGRIALARNAAAVPSR